MNKLIAIAGVVVISMLSGCADPVDVSDPVVSSSSYQGGNLSELKDNESTEQPNDVYNHSKNHRSAHDLKKGKMKKGQNDDLYIMFNLPYDDELSQLNVQELPVYTVNSNSLSDKLIKSVISETNNYRNRTYITIDKGGDFIEVYYPKSLLNITDVSEIDYETLSTLGDAAFIIENEDSLTVVLGQRGE